MHSKSIQIRNAKNHIQDKRRKWDYRKVHRDMY